ncbi:hypothetical protein [Cupriavidus pauculus]|uniref:hypothetical protein n=1 Tax=Cupriavidus pauculus TaxID=82633 RepID=UPI001FD325C1|nr:hypothetical protein [Cupriavidus pauculus]
MDIQEIARLHSRYGKAPITIEMSVEDKTVPMLDGPVPTGPTEPKAMWSRLTEAQRLVVALIVVAGIAFPIGMWAASAGKHGGEPSLSKTQATAVPAADASAVAAQGHEWPSKAHADGPTEPAAEPMPPRAQPESQPALSPTPAAVSTVPSASASAAPSKPVAKALPASAKPPDAVSAGSSAAIPAPRAAAQSGEAARRNNEIKLF